MRPTFKSLVLVGLFLMSLSVNIHANTNIEDISGLPPGEQYRQLSLILLISGGADPDLLQSLAATGIDAEGGVVSDFNPDDYKTPLIRIVDQESMLAGAAFLLRFAQKSQLDIETSLASGASVIMLGIRIPTNYGSRYTSAFEGVYRELAEQLQIPWIEFFMEAVALDETLMQADGIHPNARAQPILLDNAWPIVAKALADREPGN